MIRGALQMLDGLRLLLAEASLRQVLWRMLGLLALLVLALGAGVFWFADHLAHLWLPHSHAWYWQLVGVIAWLLALALALVSGVVGFAALGSVAASPWLDMLAARTGSLSGVGHEASAAPWLAQIMHSLAAAVRPLVFLLVLGLLALACLLVPVVGQVAATAIWGYAGIRFLNYALLDTPASRRGWDYARRTEELGRMLQGLGRRGGAVALVYLDLDRFKAINDEHGHDTGDEVLSALARRLRGAVRGDDVVARLGGDEFVLAHLSAESRPDGDLVVSRLRKVLSAPFRVRGQVFDVGASIGWVSTDRADVGPEALLARADRAMYQSKRERAAQRAAT